MSSSFRILVGRAVDAFSDLGSALIRVEQGRIAGVERWTDATTPAPGDIDLRCGLLVPGFIDIHVHGGAGRYLMDGTVETVDVVSAHLARHGVTGFLPTSVTAPWEQQRALIEASSRRMGAAGRAPGAEVLGVHLEGPYINPARRGAQPLQHIREPGVADLEAGAGSLLDCVRVMTIAPELPGALEVIRYLSRSGIIASMGHTDATFDQAASGADAGARHVTHCYNAMRQLGSREPGMVGAAMALPALRAELIWDNIHVHAASCRALITARGTEETVLISDGIPGAGMEEGYEFDLGDLPVTVREGSARLPDGTLAGSLLTLDRAFANAEGLPLSARSRMTSLNAAQALGLADRKGLLRPGFDADLTVLDAGYGVRCTLAAGSVVYREEQEM